MYSHSVVSGCDRPMFLHARDRPSYTLYSHLTPIPTTNATIGEIPNRDRINCRVNLKDKISNLKSIDSLYLINST
ncbi:hypothetical protein [Microcoleus sp.]|uniref:hypothetical protein n=1 Tax=Microcoleus sp. TaxID=44472 RepID=UPI003593CCAA